MRNRTCTELGVCHCTTPECTDAMAGFKTPTDLMEDINPDDGDGVWEQISFYGIHMLVAGMSCFVVFGSAGYLLSRFGA